MKVALLTSGGIAPCLSSSIGRLAEQYYDKYPNVEIIGYLNGYKGLLLGNSIPIEKTDFTTLYSFGGTPIGNSRVKLTNTKDCIENGYINANEDPLEVAAMQLKKDGVDVLHTIGGDDTNTTAGDLVEYLDRNNYKLTVVGLPKTIDNDVYPISLTLGAITAAQQTAHFFKNIVNENTTSSRQLIIHEVMGRNCGWLTAKASQIYLESLEKQSFAPDLNIPKEKWNIHAIYIPEHDVQLEGEFNRLNKIMDQYDCVNIFLSEGAGINSIISDMEKENVEVPRDAFGHVRLDDINPGQWFAKKLKSELNADKVLVQKSGYFSRSAPSSKEDLDIIFKTVDVAIESAIKGESGVVGFDEDNNDKLSCINFSRIKGGKPFNINADWFLTMMKEIGQIN
jgi:pyrophosphate--fructose-6-phosphate 1-phosphotransferase